MDNLDWNDLRYVVAIARSGSAAAAARLLGVSHATVLRRVATLEEGIGTALFYRQPTGYEPTEAGQQLAEVGASIEAAVTSTRRAIDGQTKDLAGTIRFTTTDSFASELMPPILARFHERYPQIRIEMIATNALLDLDRRDADVALRPTGQPPESWVGTRLSGLDMGLYAATAYIEKQPGDDWRTFHWVFPGGPLSRRAMTQWLNTQVPEERRVMTVDSLVAMRELALEGVGATVLPHHMARDRRLRLLYALPADMSGAVWLLTHANLRQTQRIKVFMRHVADSVRTTLLDSSPSAEPS